MSMDIQTLIQAKFSGPLENASIYINLVVQAVAVLIGGIVMWRLSNRYHAKKQKERERNPFFTTPYSTWKKK